MILGTVQLGLNYGINNNTGKPDKKKAFEIFDFAYNHDIKMLDSGPMYGDAEEIIGEYFKNNGQKFIVSTKLPDYIKNEKNPRYNEVENVVRESLEKLCIDNAFCYYLHQFYQCKFHRLMVVLNECKKKGLYENLGISIYSPCELIYICKNLYEIIDVVQIPYNIFSLHLWDDALRMARGRGIKIYARSIFLQGLAFKNNRDFFVSKLGVEKFIAFIHELACRRGTGIDQLCFDSVYGNDYIDDIIIGCETLDQLKKNLRMENNFRPIKGFEIKEIHEMMESIPEDALNPQTWGKYK